MIVVNFDGLCEPVNPGGIATYGYIIKDDAGLVIAKKSGVVGKGPQMSNNVAEYAALCECLNLLLRREVEKPTVVSSRRLCLLGESISPFSNFALSFYPLLDYSVTHLWAPLARRGLKQPGVLGVG